jgi:ribose transport system substrate-binding protein
MKQKRLVALLLVVAIAVFMTACAAPPTNTEAAADDTAANDTAAEDTVADDTAADDTAADDTVTVTSDAAGEYYMITFVSGIDYWKGCFAGFERAANAVGATAIYTGTPDADFAAEVDVLNQVIAKNPKGIAITCMDPDAFIDPINAAIAAGIPVVTFDSDSPTSDRYTYLGTGNEAAGAAAAAYMADELGGVGEVGVVYFTGSLNQEQRAAGFENYMAANYPDITVIQKVHGGDDETSSSAAAAAMITANPNLKGIFGSNAWMGLGVGNAIEEAGKVGEIVAVAFDTDSGVLDYIESGTLSASVVQGTQQMGFWSFEFLWACNTDGVVDDWQGKGVSPVPGSVDTGVSMATADNVDLFR